jgi:SAM-dependent methyltransferase
MDIRFPGECPVCRSKFLSLACRRQTPQVGTVDVYHCMACQSFCSPYAPEHLNGPSLNHHLTVFERNQGFTQVWLERVQAHWRPTKILDIGCGIGSLLHAAREQQGIAGIGYDLDTESCEHGRQAFDLDLRGRAWSADEDTPAVDLITCIMVLEHIKWPRPLMLQLVRAAKRFNCPVYVSVPWFNRATWPHLHGPFGPGNFLELPYVHVTHFAEQAFVDACKGMGARDFTRVSGCSWPGYLFTA